MTSKLTSGTHWPEEAMSRDAFIRLVWDEGRKHYRDLPWRNIDDAYAVLVSEIMLQQTQVSRVERFWKRFLASFPTIDALAAANTADVLEHWQGLGYNRRALALKRAADICAADWEGRLPKTREGLESLPGIGPATAAGVMAFAYQKPAVYIETNVRTVFIHHLFPDEEKVSDKTLAPLVESTCSRVDPRGWYYALLDYGAFLKQQVGNVARRSSAYSRQSTFEGSRRQKRAWIVRRVLAEPEGIALTRVLADLNAYECGQGRSEVGIEAFNSIVGDLVGEGFFQRQGKLLVP